MSVCVCERERERESVCERERERVYNITTLPDQEKLAYLLGEHKTCCVLAAQYVSLLWGVNNAVPKLSRRRRRSSLPSRRRQTVSNFEWD